MLSNPIINWEKALAQHRNNESDFRNTLARYEEFCLDNSLANLFESVIHMDYLSIETNSSEAKFDFK